MGADISKSWPDLELLRFRKVELHWSERELLRQQAWYPYRDVMRQLGLLDSEFAKQAERLHDHMLLRGENPRALLGLHRFGQRLWVKMPQFAVWYRAERCGRLGRIPENWDFQTLLAQKDGMFSLSRVFMLLPAHWPLTYRAMQALINHTDDSRASIGAERLEQLGYVVFMPQFGEWARRQLSS